MKMTSAQAAKLLRQLNDELKALQKWESSTKTFIVSIGEEVESVRPVYDYAEMQKEQIEVETKIRKLKHSLNIFNTTTIIPEFEMTIDEMLVYLPQLTQRKSKLSDMKDVLPKERESTVYNRNSNIIDYRYANYDIDQVSADYNEVSDKLAKAQTALDYINSTKEFEVEL